MPLPAIYRREYGEDAAAIDRPALFVPQLSARFADVNPANWAGSLVLACSPTIAECVSSDDQFRNSDV
jgi:hypothetical protein